MEKHMKKVQHDNSATQKKCKMKRMEHSENASLKKQNMERVQHEQSTKIKQNLEKCAKEDCTIVHKRIIGRPLTDRLYTGNIFWYHKIRLCDKNMRNIKFSTSNK